MGYLLEEVTLYIFVNCKTIEKNNKISNLVQLIKEISFLTNKKINMIKQYIFQIQHFIAYDYK